MYFSFSISLAFALLIFSINTQAASNYYGKFIGSLKSYHHALAGDVYVVDSRTLHIRNYNYDGEGPAGYFYVSNTKTPNENGIKLRDERGSTEPLKRYRKKHITLTLPEGKTISNIKWFYVWCDEFSVNFGDVKIPKNLDFPKPQKIGRFNGVHSVSSDNVIVVDAQTLLIPSFSYDGEAPDAKFWIGGGSKPTAQGVRVPDENGKEDPLRKYDKKTIVLTLPGDITVFDIGNFAIWCEAFTVDFGHIQIPKDLNVPPSLKMLGVSPQSKLNCEILYDDLAFEVRWAVAGESIVIQLVAKLEKGEYMSFGVSGQIDRNTMIGGDVVVSWIDQETLNGYAYDYYLDAKSQCAGGHGSCPDVKLQPNTENIRLLNAALVNGYSIVTYQRPLRAHDEVDLPIYTNGSQAIIWAIGPLNSLQEVSYHSITSKATTLIDFGRPPQWNCPIPESDASVANSENNENFETSTINFANEHVRVQTEPTIRSRVPEQKEPEITRSTPKRVEATPAPVKREKPWDIPPIQCYEPEDGIFYAQMGPTGGKRGYSAITGHVGWGISWYINGLLIPEINVVRGRSYTFVVEGGLDPEIPAKYHPFYITDDPVGGYHYKTPEERAKVRVFAGVTQNKAGEVMPTGVGRLCNWTPDPDQPPADEFASFGAYQRTLSLVCDHGEPGVVQWTPDENTPDTVYYQCFSHRYLGWKINVHDTCDKEAAESEQVTTRVHAEDDGRPDELLPNPSIQVETRVKPSSNFSVAHANNVIEGHKPHKSKPNASNGAQFKDMQKLNFAENEAFMLQDPYLPPPPYQKNFDYQSLQSTESMKEIKSITEKVAEYKELTRLAPAKTHLGFYANYTKPYHQTASMAKQHKNYAHKEPYSGFKNPTMMTVGMGTSEYPAQAPGVHIHIIKHAHSEEEEDVDRRPLKPYGVGVPVGRHPMMAKKPIHKGLPYSYPARGGNKMSKQTEQQGSGSIPSKIILAPPSRNAMTMLPHGPMMASYPMSQHQLKKSFHNNRKREEQKTALPQHFVNRIEEQPERKYQQGGFNPSSIVIESGFKPIIPSTETHQNLNVAQERVDQPEDSEDYFEPETKELTTVNNTIAAAAVEEHSKNPFEGKEPESFEPMFIPSPLINEHQRKKKPHEQRFKIKIHKPDQNIVYIWPNDDIPSSQMKDAYYNNFYSTNTASPPHFKGFEQSDAATQNENVVDNHQSSVVNKSNKGVGHNYKVTEYEDRVSAEVGDVITGNSTTEKLLAPFSPESDQKSVEADSNYKIKYIPVGYSIKESNADTENNKFVITVPENDVTESTNSSSIV